jgi:hypothetical protein
MLFQTLMIISRNFNMLTKNTKTYRPMRFTQRGSCCPGANGNKHNKIVTLNLSFPILIKSTT